MVLYIHIFTYVCLCTLLFQDVQVCRSSFNKSWQYAESHIQCALKSLNAEWLAGDVGVANFSRMLFLTTRSLIFSFSRCYILLHFLTSVIGSSSNYVPSSVPVYFNTVTTENNISQLVIQLDPVQL